MARSLLLLIGGVVLIFAISLFSTRSPETDTIVSVASITGKDTPPGVFLPNLGELDIETYFYLRRDRSLVYLKPTGIEIEAQVFDDAILDASLYFVDANKAPRVEGLQPLRRRTGFLAVKYRDLYPGIDLTLLADPDELSGSLTLHPEANPDLILFEVNGSNGSPFSELTAYQEIDGETIPVDARFAGARYGSTKLDLGVWNSSEPVAVDFTLTL